MTGDRPSTLADRLAASASSLTPTDRRVAEVVLEDRELVAFGTVAEVAARAGTSGASVVRLADRLDYRGFRGLQDAVRAELSERLGPATRRIRRPAPGDLVATAADVTATAVRRTLEQTDSAAFRTAVRLLARRGHRLFVLCGDSGAGVGRQAVTHLSMVREGVEAVSGDPVAVGRSLARADRDDVMLCVDLPRHDRWVLDAAAAARGRGVAIVAVVDSPMSPLAQDAAAVLAVDVADIGPFDSYVPALAVVEVLVAGVAERLKGSASERLDALEAFWSDSEAIEPADEIG